MDFVFQLFHGLALWNSWIASSLSLTNMRFIPFILFLFLASTSYGQNTNPQEQTIVRIDTIITFHPATYEETIEVVVVYAGEEQKEEKADFKYETTEKNGVDTLIIFNPKTMKEETIIVKRTPKK